eukprot:294489-Pelagomonas_calceolata.AAC.1
MCAPATDNKRKPNVGWAWNFHATFGRLLRVNTCFSKVIQGLGSTDSPTHTQENCVESDISTLWKVILAPCLHTSLCCCCEVTQEITAKNLLSWNKDVLLKLIDVLIAESNARPRPGGGGFRVRALVAVG